VRLHKLTEVAERLGCHVETLRLRVRKGQLKVSRGPHGRYYVDGRELARLPDVRRTGPPIAFTERDLAAGWKAVEDVLDERGAHRPSVQAVIRNLAISSPRDRPFYRLLAVRAYRLAGLNHNQIAHELGISSRHVRRLDDRFDNVMGRFYRSGTARWRGPELVNALHHRTGIPDAPKASQPGTVCTPTA